MASDINHCLVTNPDGELPLHLACRTLHDVHKEIVLELLKCDGEIAKQQLQAVVIPAEDGKGFDGQQCATEDCAALDIVAAGFRNKEIVELLIEKCVELEILVQLLERENRSGDTIVHVAASKGYVRLVGAHL